MKNRQPMSYRDKLGRYAKLYPKPQHGDGLELLLIGLCVLVGTIAAGVLMWGGR